MTAPSNPSEALETVEDLIRRDPACFNLSDELQSVRSALRAALATLSRPTPETREQLEKLLCCPDGCMEPSACGAG